MVSLRSMQTGSAIQDPSSIIRLFFLFFAQLVIGRLADTDNPVVILFLILSAISCVICACVPSSQPLRLTACCLSIATLYFIIYSPVKINHGYHYWIYVLVIFAVSSLRDMRATLFWAQVTILSTYTLAGFWKLLDALQRCAEPVVSQCSVNGFSYILSDRILQTGEVGILTNFFIQNPWVGFVSFWLVIVFQLTAPFFFIRFERMRIPIAYGLILFHLLVYLTFHIGFYSEVTLLTLLFILPEYLVPRTSQA